MFTHSFTHPHAPLSLVDLSPHTFTATFTTLTTTTTTTTTTTDGLSADGFKNGGDSFSKEAIRTLLTEVENNRTGTVVILAGYAEPMKHLLRADPGLPRRFPHNLDLPNYSVEQLASIVKYCAETRYGKTLDDEGLEAKVAVHIRNHHRRDMAEQNGGLSVNMAEAAVAAQANRIMKAVEMQVDGAWGGASSGGAKGGLQHAGGSLPSHAPMILRTPSQMRSNIKERKKELVLRQRPDVLVAQDFGITAEMELGASDAEKAEVEAELNALVGMDNVKDFFHKMRDVRG